MLTKQVLAKSLYEIGALQFQPEEPFTWSSGIQSPVYCDNRLTMSEVTLRREIAESLAEKIRSSFPETEVIAGCATAGIPHAAWVADILNLPMVYVRSKAKGHGKQNQIEGIVVEGQKAIVIEDLISTGNSSLTTAQSLRDSGLDVLGVLAIFTYELKESKQAFHRYSLPLYTLTNFEELLAYMHEIGRVSQQEQLRLLLWKDDPANFSYTYQP